MSDLARVIAVSVRASVPLALLATSGCGDGEDVAEPGDTGDDCAASPKEFLAQSTFHVPNPDGENNQNGFIGYFCCTGITSTVRSRCGDAVGYVHFFFWDGTAFNTSDGDAAVTDIRLDLTGSRDVQTPRSPHDTGAVSFVAGVDQIGAVKRATVGDLYYSVTLERAELYPTSGTSPFWRWSTLAVQYDVALTDAAQGRVHAPRPPYYGDGVCRPNDTSGWSCAILPRGSCSYAVPTEIASEPCATQLTFHVDYVNEWNSNVQPVPTTANCATIGVSVRADYSTIDLCPRFCTQLMDMASKITLRSTGPGCVPAP